MKRLCAAFGLPAVLCLLIFLGFPHTQTLLAQQCPQGYTLSGGVCVIPAAALNLSGQSLTSGRTTITGLSSPAVTITQAGTPATTSYTYVVVGTDAGGGTKAIAKTTATGAATLNSTDYNIVTVAVWLGASPNIFPAGACSVLRTAGGATQGTIGIIANCSAGGNLHDTGLAAVAPLTPPADTSGTLTVAAGVALPPSTVLFGLPLTNATFVSAKSYAMGAGDVTIYTAPPGRRGLITIIGGFNPGANSVTWYPELKVGSAYYRLANTTTGTGAGTQPVSVVVGIVLEPNESIAVNTTASGMNLTAGIIEFDATSPMRTVKTLGPASGNQVFYTSTKSTLIMPGTMASPGNTKSQITYAAGSVAAANTTMCFVASGGSTACAANSANQVVGSSVGANAITNISFGYYTMSAGDFLVVNPTTGDPAQIIWMNILEL